MLRSTNPYNDILSESTIFVDVLSTEEPRRRMDFAGESFADNGGLQKCATATAIMNSIFSISHGKVDGYGFLVQLSKEFQNFSFAGSIDTRENFIDGNKYIQFLAKRTPAQKMDRTFTQQFVYDLLTQFQRLRSENIGVVVNLETEDLSVKPWGNGIVIPTLNGEKLFELSLSTKEKWRQDLADIARRTLSILQKRPKAAASLSSVVISSLGHVGNRAGKNEITAQNSIISATPIFPSSMNVFLYCDDHVQSLVLCGSEDHWLFSQVHLLEKIWRALC